MELHFCRIQPNSFEDHEKAESRTEAMTVETKDIKRIAKSTERVGGMVWNIMGQIYIPKKVDKDSFWWAAIMPTESFVPPHVHTTQDKFLYITDGELDLLFDDKEVHAEAGEVFSFPRNSNHGLFNNSGKTVKAVFWVNPTERLFDLFKAIHNVADTGKVVRISDTHDIHFQLPGQKARYGRLGQ